MKLSVGLALCCSWFFFLYPWILFLKPVSTSPPFPPLILFSFLYVPHPYPLFLIFLLMFLVLPSNPHLIFCLLIDKIELHSSSRNFLMPKLNKENNSTRQEHGYWIVLLNQLDYIHWQHFLTLNKIVFYSIRAWQLWYDWKSMPPIYAAEDHHHQRCCLWSLSLLFSFVKTLHLNYPQCKLYMLQLL